MITQDPREARLPNWAREIINNLRKRLEAATEPMVKELAKLRPQMALLKARNESMQELLECAAKGGHRSAQEIMDIIGQYDLTLTKRGDDNG